MLLENSIDTTYSGTLRSISDETRMNNPSVIPRAEEGLDKIFQIIAYFYVYTIKDF